MEITGFAYKCRCGDFVGAGKRQIIGPGFGIYLLTCENCRESLGIFYTPPDALGMIQPKAKAEKGKVDID